MKKLYLILLLLITTTLICNAQTRKYTIASIDSGQTKVDSVKVPDGYWLSQINFPSLVAGTDSVSFEIASFLEGTLTWKEYWYDGAKYVEVIKSGGNAITGLVPSKTWAAEWFKLVLDAEQDTTYNFEFTFEKKQ